MTQSKSFGLVSSLLLSTLALGCTVRLSPEHRFDNPAPPQTPGVDATSQSPQGSTADTGITTVDWDRVSSPFNRSVVDEMLTTTTQQEQLDIGFSSPRKEVSLRYDSAMAPNQIRVATYHVSDLQSSGSESYSRIDHNRSIILRSAGRSSCHIRVENRLITSLQGACIVKLEIAMSPESTVEVYNDGELISRRHRVVTNSQLLNRLSTVIIGTARFEIIDDYLSSYLALGRAAALTSRELGQIVRGFLLPREKIVMLRRLHAHVSDRNALGTMIDAEFLAMDRPAARAAVGL